MNKKEIEKIIKELGSMENEYTIRAIDGKWWIEHSVLGSGEPLEQFLEDAMEG